MTTLGSNMCICLCLWVHIIVSRWVCLLCRFKTPFANHIWCLDHLDRLTHLSCISRLTKISKMSNTFYVLLMRSRGTCSNDLATEHRKIIVSSQFPKHGSNPHFSQNVYSQAVQLLPMCFHPESGHPCVNQTLTRLQKDLSIPYNMYILILW